MEGVLPQEAHPPREQLGISMKTFLKYKVTFCGDSTTLKLVSGNLVCLLHSLAGSLQPAWLQGKGTKLRD